MISMLPVLVSNIMIFRFESNRLSELQGLVGRCFQHNDGNSAAELGFEIEPERYIAVFQHHATGCSQVSSHKQHLTLQQNVPHQTKIEIQGCTKELQTRIPRTAPQQLIVQGKLISLPRRHYYSTILTFFFFFDFSDDNCGISEVVVLLSAPRACDPSEALPDMFECPRLLLSFLFCLCLGVGSALHWPSERAEPWLLRFFDALVNRDLVFLEEPERPQEL